MLNIIGGRVSRSQVHQPEETNILASEDMLTRILLGKFCKLTCHEKEPGVKI